MKRKITTIILSLTMCVNLLCGCKDIPVEIAVQSHIATETCRRYIDSYSYDAFTYTRYKDSEDVTEQAMAFDAKFNANQTAEAYNKYVEKYVDILGGTDNLSEGLTPTLEILK